MKLKNKNLIVIMLNVVSLFLLYVRITSYYQITAKIVNYFDSRLKHYILFLWLLLGLLLIADLLFYILQKKELDKSIILMFWIIIMIFIGCVAQFARAPNYEDYHITPFAMKPTEVEKQINAKKFNLFDFPIYFYKNNNPDYKMVRKKIREYSIKNQNDFGSINIGKLKRGLGVKRSKHILKVANVHSNNALVYTLYDSEGRSRIITFNNLQNEHTFRKAIRFIDSN